MGFIGLGGLGNDHLRQETAMSSRWIAQRLQVGS